MTCKYDSGGRRTVSLSGITEAISTLQRTLSGLFHKEGSIDLTDNLRSWDYTEKRVGDRVVSLGEKPSFNPRGTSRRESLGLTESRGWIGTGPRK